MLQPARCATAFAAGVLLLHGVRIHGAASELRPPASLPVEFEENVGQAPTGVRFLVHAAGITGLILEDGSLRLRRSAAAGRGTGELHIEFPGASSVQRIAGEALTAHRTFSYRGSDPRAWHEALPTYSRVRCTGVYPGIDLIYTNRDGRLEYQFELRPGADPSLIRMRVGPSGRVKKTAAGDLLLKSGDFSIRQRRPEAFYAGSGQQRVPVRYVASGGPEVRFALEPYDRTARIIIDPALNVLSYLGGGGFDSAFTVTRDSQRNIYIAGETLSPALDGTASGSRPYSDVMVVKLSPDGKQVLYTVILGGSGRDTANAMAVDAAQQVYLTGSTTSSNFPVTSEALLSSAQGMEDAFVLRLGASGNLTYSTYLGQAGPDMGTGIAVGPGGSVYVAGQTGSPQFPVTSTAFLRTYAGGWADCFVTKLSSAMALVSSTFVGGVGTDICTGIAIDAGQNMLIAGSTDSADFPLVNPIAGQTRGGNEAFVAKLNADGTALVFSTTLGGTGTDAAQTVSVDSSDNVYVAGYTSSFNFPLKPLLPPPAGYDAFLCRLSSTGSLSYARLLGGRGDDIASAVSVDGSGTAVIAGYTTSLDLPITDGWQSDSKGNFEAFAAGFDSAGKTVFSSYLGGSGDDRAYAVHSAGGDVTVVGITSSSDLSVRSAVQPARAPSYDSFLAVFTLARAVTAARRSLYTQSTTLREVGRWDLQGDTGVTLDPSVVLAASGSADWSVVAVADVNRDGTPDLVWQHASLGYAQAWLMGGASGSNIIGAIVLNDRVVSGWNIVAALDLNRDGFTDLIWQNSSGIAQVWYLGGASRAQITGAALLNGGATTWKIVAAGDLNKDGVPDLIWQAPGGIAQVWYMGGTDGSKIIGAAMISSIEVPNWRIAALADMNSDGQNDVIWQQDSGVVQVWHMGGTSGSTVTGAATVPNFASAVRIVGAVPQ